MKSDELHNTLAAHLVKEQWEMPCKFPSLSDWPALTTSTSKNLEAAILFEQFVFSVSSSSQTHSNVNIPACIAAIGANPILCFVHY